MDAVQFALERVDIRKLIIDAPSAKGRLRLRPEYFLDGLIPMLEVSFLCLG